MFFEFESCFALVSTIKFLENQISSVNSIAIIFEKNETTLYLREHSFFSLHPYIIQCGSSIQLLLGWPYKLHFAHLYFSFQKKRQHYIWEQYLFFFPLHFAHLYFSLHYIRLHYTDLRSRSTEPASSPVLHILVPAFQGLSSWNYNRCVNLFQNCNWWVNAILTWSMFNWCSSWWTVTEILQTEQTLYKARFRMLKHKLFPL